MRTLRESNERLAERVGRLETREAVQAARPAAPGAQASATPEPAGAAPASQDASTSVLPPLTVVKLRPKRAPAPRLPTQVAVVEPEPEDVEAFVQAGPAEPPTPAARELPEVDPALLDAAYERAVAGLRTGDVEASATALRRFAEEHPRHPRADNALYLAGLGLAGLKDWAAAAQLFERLVASYPAGDTVLDAMLRLAECRSRLQQPDAARALYTRVVTQFPGTAAATQAEQRLAALSK